MHKKFDSGIIEKKWQERWRNSGIYDVGARDESKESEYVLVEWPYPSGNLHIGHWYAFAVPDIYVRYKRMLGKQMLFPMGFDAFGLPAENAAIKRNLNPKDWTDSNMAYMRNQLDSMGNSFSWDKTTSSTDPEYYKWTQWMFTQFFENDIAYRGVGIVNWCESCHTAIANEQVKPDGTCERCGNPVEKREMPQWMLRITKYADRLVDDLDPLDWPEHIKEAQRQWIGRSKGALIDFKLGTGDTVKVFTTRPDTLFGATYMVLAPEHPLVTQNQAKISNWVEVSTYINETKQKAEQDRLDNTKEKTGVKLEGITATNPANGEEIPVYIADYVLATYGTGAIMAVPAHDDRDNAFAKKFNLPIKQVIARVHNQQEKVARHRHGVYGIIENEGRYLIQDYKIKGHYWLPGGGIEEGENEHESLRREILEESGYVDFEIEHKVGEAYLETTEFIRNFSTVYKIRLNSLDVKETKFTLEEIEDGLENLWLTEEEIRQLKPEFEAPRVDLILQMIRQSKGEIFSGGGIIINSGEFDGMDSEKAKKAIVKKVGGEFTNTYRLRDWSIGRQRYWGVPIPIVYDPEGKAHVVPKEHLPWTLPTDVDFTPTGVPPLAKSQELKERTEKIFGAGWTPEVETMDTFVDSSWYFLRYLDNENSEELSSLSVQKDWMPIDIYFGGAEHTTMHLLYSRFWQKALFDLGLVTESEPYKKRINRGLILGPDGNKMSKSKGNVIDPDEQVQKVGSDTVKMYLAFMGPYEGANYPFDLGGIAGIRRFLERVYGLTDHIKTDGDKATTKLIHKTIKKVRADIQEYKFNTAISAFMILVNQVEKTAITPDEYKTILRLVAPFAPHLTEELWTELGEKKSIHLESFPVADEALAKDESAVIGVQVNGKLRGDITVNLDQNQDEVIELLKGTEIESKYLNGHIIRKVIYVPGRILNLVVE